jgi:DNA-binding NarL/FixJ family response regulator
LKRIMVVDDHDLLRESLTGMFAAEDDVEVVAVCADGADAIELADRLRPDVIVMDLQMPGVNGAEATRAILRGHPELRIVILTASPASGLAAEALAAGAVACVTKNGDCAALLGAIRAA